MPKPKHSSEDALRQTVNEIRELLQQQGTPVFLGLDPDVLDKLPRVYWRQDLGGSWQDFLKTAQELAAKPVYVHWIELADMMLDAPTIGEDERRELGSHIDEVCAFDLSFFHNGVLHVYHDLADWFTEYEELLDFPSFGSDLLSEDDDLDHDKPF